MPRTVFTARPAISPILTKSSIGSSPKVVADQITKACERLSRRRQKLRVQFLSLGCGCRFQLEIKSRLGDSGVSFANEPLLALYSGSQSSVRPRYKKHK